MGEEGKLITLTGTDRIGKETQSGLLKEAMRHSGRPVEAMTFPEYGEHWAAEFVRATLNEEFITVHREGGKPLTLYPKKHPYIFQMWQSADRLDRQPWIEGRLAAGVNLVADRYEIDALAYGLVDGCDEFWLDAMNDLYRPSDLICVLVGQPFPRPGEKPDLNERNIAFQGQVRAAYEALCSHWAGRCRKVDVDDYRRANPYTSKWEVHVAICGAVAAQFGWKLSPLTRSEVELREDLRAGGYAEVRPGG